MEDMLGKPLGCAAKALIPTVPTPSNASAVAPIGPDIRTPIAITVAPIGVARINVTRIGVSVAWISITISRISAIIARVSWICVTWVSGPNIDVLGGGFERHHCQEKSDSAHT